MNKRPISPHLSIYKQKITGTLSILHRITGVITFFSLLILSWWFILIMFSGFDEKYLSCFSCIFIKLPMFFITHSLFYHFWNGIRHLMWDFGMCMDMKSVTFTGVFVVAMSIFANVCFWMKIIN